MLPTDIYHAQSSDLLLWNVTPHTPVLTHLGGTSWEFDQVAGPQTVVKGENAFLFYDGDNNEKGTCSIGVALAPARRMNGAAAVV